MPNQHLNTKLIRVPVRTHERIRRVAEREGLTIATQVDVMVDQWTKRRGFCDILEQTSSMPEPRRQAPPLRETPPEVAEAPETPEAEPTPA